jgi:hypothetical protein
MKAVELFMSGCKRMIVSNHSLEERSEQLRSFLTPPRTVSLVVEGMPFSVREMAKNSQWQLGIFSLCVDMIG